MLKPVVVLHLTKGIVMLYLPDNHKITLHLNAKDCYTILTALEEYREYNDDLNEEVAVTLNKILQVVDEEEVKLLDDDSETFIKNHPKDIYEY